jgi:hypothetical protein
MNGVNEAGGNLDIRLAYVQERIAERLHESAVFLEASHGLRGTDRPGAESAARSALLSCARALDWAEDSDREDEIHQRLDLLGLYVRTTFGCTVYRDGNQYRITCPVHIAHRRIGLSIGGTAQRVCSLCGYDISECEHLGDRAYIVTGGKNDLGWCRVCCKETCDHVASQEYRTAPVAIIQHMNLEEISIVSKPAQPEARFTSMPLSISTLVEGLGPRFRPGMDVSCDRCLSKCGGLIRYDFSHA